MIATREVELKLGLPPGAAARVLHHPLVTASRTAEPRRVRLAAVYLDTPDAALAGAGISLRVRREGRRWVQTVKGPTLQGAGALAARLEASADRGPGATPPWPDAAHWHGTPWQRVLDEALAAGLAPRFATDILRTIVPLRFADGTTATLCLDAGVLAAGGNGEARVSEMEIELGEGMLATLFRFASALLVDVPLRIEPRSKSARGLALAGVTGRKPIRARTPQLDPDADAATAMRAVLDACLHQVVGNADGLADDDDVEWVHQLRIGTRRLRAALALVRGEVPRDLLRPVRDDARWLARALGPVRDLDVLVTQTLPRVRQMVAGTEAARAAVDAFAARAEALRAVAKTAARAAVVAPRYSRLVLGAGELASLPRLGSMAGTPAAARMTRSASRYAAAIQSGRHRSLQRSGKGLAGAGPDARHALRLAAKKMRYGTEFFAGLFEPGPTRKYRRALVRLQDALGAQNDATVALRLATAIDGADSAIAVLVRDWAHGMAHDADTQVLRRWRAFAAQARLPKPA